MPKLIIDGIEVEVPAGTNVLEAAKKVGIVIPHFCYHPALGSVGACRLCAMKFIDGPVKGVQVSCMIEAKDGMVVSTTDGEAARLRRLVIEWLMMNHPHDCPVCDEGGMCLLQDYTVSSGHGLRRYKGKKRTFTSQYLGEYIQHEMNRCIQCYRCARFYNDYAGGTDFGPLQIANKVYFGRFKEGWLESEYSGNLAEVCPTGVLTDKTYRFKGRLWDLEQSPSVCPHCSLGCNVIPGARYRKLLRITARENRAVNGWFICDRGRFGYGFAGREDRPRSASAYGIEATYDKALDVAANRLRDIIDAHGKDSVAFMGSPRASVETNWAVKRLAQAVGSPHVCYSPDYARERKDRLAASLLAGGPARSLKGVERSDFILAAGVDPVNEAPMLALMMRQAVRNGARVFVIDPRPVRLPFEFTHLPVPPSGLADALTDTLAHELGGSTAPTLVAGTDVGDDALLTRAAEELRRLKETCLEAGLMYVMAGPNSFGNAVLAGEEQDFEEVMRGITDGRVKALVVAECDPAGRCRDEAGARAALAKLEGLIVMDYLPTPTAGSAHVLLPTTAFAEDDGVFVNNEGRAQAYVRAYVPGMPINEMGPAKHPQREFSVDVPGRAYPAWRIALRLASMMNPGFEPPTGIHEIREQIAGEDPSFAPIVHVKPESEGALLTARTRYTPPAPATREDTSGSGIRLLAVELTFGTEELSVYSDKTQLRSPEPYVALCAGDAGRLGLVDGDTVVIGYGETTLSCKLTVSDSVAPGVAVAPRLAGLPAASLDGKYVDIHRCPTCPTA